MIRAALSAEAPSIARDIQAAEDLPEVLYEMAPAEAHKRAAQHLANARARLEWLERILVGSANGKGVAISSLAAPLNRGRTTVARWAAEPLRVDDQGTYTPDLPHVDLHDPCLSREQQKAQLDDGLDPHERVLARAFDQAEGAAAFVLRSLGAEQSGGTWRLRSDTFEIRGLDIHIDGRTEPVRAYGLLAEHFGSDTAIDIVRRAAA